MRGIYGIKIVFEVLRVYLFAFEICHILLKICKSKEPALVKYKTYLTDSGFNNLHISSKMHRNDFLNICEEWFFSPHAVEINVSLPDSCYSSLNTLYRIECRLIMFDIGHEKN